ncbi:helix-turn-helix domain-containing protein [Moraxella caprae]|uniref:helix-turn-helix domain-containing protein n=1 Tax=Moraxella caprae TaxID=90240 RepID=UPI000A01C384|nr:helix-turn-helix domain-containing protein [Moraxella caprae]
MPFSLFQATYQGQKLFDFAVCSDNGKAILSDNLADNHKLDDLANRVHLSKRSFNRYFKTATQMTLSQWLTAKRLAKVQDYLESTDLPIEIIADKTGFGTASNL